MIGRNRIWVLLVAGLIVATPVAAQAVPATQADWRRDALMAASRPAERSEFQIYDRDLQPGLVETIGCEDGSQCPGTSAALDHAQRWLNRPKASPLAPMTIVVNAALIGLGLLWLVLARRSVPKRQHQR